MWIPVWPGSRNLPAVSEPRVWQGLGLPLDKPEDHTYVLRVNLLREGRIALYGTFRGALLLVASSTTTRRARHLALWTPFDPGSLFDGTNVTGITHYGVSANITAQKGALCGGASASMAWTMIAGVAVGGYAQSGYWHLQGSSSIYQFAEYRKNSNVNFVYKQGASVTAGAKTNYQQIYNFSSGLISMWIGSNDLLDTNFDPAVAWGGSTWYAEWEGETPLQRG